jgi:hypothetical protein
MLLPHVPFLHMLAALHPETIPSVTLFEGAPDKPIDIAELCKGKKVVIIGVPGGFSSFKQSYCHSRSVSVLLVGGSKVSFPFSRRRLHPHL